MKNASPRRARLLFAASLAALGAAILARCASAPDDDARGVDAVGALTVTVTLPRTGIVARVGWTVAGPALPPRSGSGALEGARVAFALDELPPAPDYRLVLSAISPDGGTRCQRRVPFAITAGTTTKLVVTLPCQEGGVLPPNQPEPAATGEPDTAVSAACRACEETNIANGKCEPDAGCGGLTGEDRKLCLAAVACMRATSCWVKDPLDCLCGSATGVECAQGGGNGDCRAEIQAATRTLDPLENGKLFYEPSVPAGRATRLIACDFDNCRAVCAVH